MIMNKQLRTLFYSLCAAPLVHAQIRGGFNQQTLLANDDLSTGLVPLGFGINFFGEEFSSAYVNNNGNITFNAPLSTFTPDTVNLESLALIAPFFADIDTRGLGSSPVVYGTGTVNGNNAFGVNWVNVGFFSNRDDLLNSFQLVLVERSDVEAGAFDIEFNYAQIQFETGNASGGVDGFGGSSARVGFSNGSGEDGSVVELSGSAVNGALVDGGPEALIDRFSSIDGEDGRLGFAVRGGELLLVFTPVEVVALRDSLQALSSFSVGDVNNRLLRHRTSFNNASDSNLYTEINDNIAFEAFGTYRYFSQTTDSRALPNAGGFIVSEAPETRLSLHTATVGVELQLNKTFHFGLAGAGSRGEAKYTDGGFNVDIDSYSVSGYIAANFDDLIGSTDLYLDLLYSRGDGSFDTNRVNGVGSTDFDLEQIAFNAGLVFEHGNFRHGPTVRFTSSDSKLDSFSEEAGRQGFFPAVSIDSAKVRVGYQASYRQNGNLSTFYPHIRFDFEREFEDQDSNIEGILLPETPDNAYIVGAGLIYNPGAGAHLALDAEYVRYADSDIDSFNVSASVAVSF